jgi:hypothetical protein
VEPERFRRAAFGLAVDGGSGRNGSRQCRQADDDRASRIYDVPVGSLRFFTEVTNLTDRANPCCLDYDPVTSADGSQTLARVERNGMPFMANVGVLWEF